MLRRAKLDLKSSGRLSTLPARGKRFHRPQKIKNLKRPSALRLSQLLHLSCEGRIEPKITNPPRKTFVSRGNDEFCENSASRPGRSTGGSLSIPHPNWASSIQIPFGSWMYA